MFLKKKKNCRKVQLSGLYRTKYEFLELMWFDLTIRFNAFQSLIEVFFLFVTNGKLKSMELCTSTLNNGTYFVEWDECKHPNWLKSKLKLQVMLSRSYNQLFRNPRQPTINHIIKTCFWNWFIYLNFFFWKFSKPFTLISPWFQTTLLATAVLEI